MGFYEDDRIRRKNSVYNDLYVVRLFDGFDYVWIDVSDPVPYNEAKKVWDQETKNGTEKTSYDDIDYYKIFPADTKMKYTWENELMHR